MITFLIYVTNALEKTYFCLTFRLTRYTFICTIRGSHCVIKLSKNRYICLAKSNFWSDIAKGCYTFAWFGCSGFWVMSSKISADLRSLSVLVKSHKNAFDSKGIFEGLTKMESLLKPTEISDDMTQNPTNLLLSKPTQASQAVL